MGGAARQAGRHGHAPRLGGAGLPLLEAFKAWLLACRGKTPKGSSSAKVIDYTPETLGGADPLPDGWVRGHRQQLDREPDRPIAVGPQKNWLFAGSLRAGKRAAAIMTLIQSARLNGHEPFAYLKDILTRLPTPPQSRIGAVAASVEAGVSLRHGQGGSRGLTLKKSQ